MDQLTRPTADLRSIQLALSGEFFDRADVKRRMIGEVYRPWELKLADERWVADLTRKLCKERCLSHVRKGRICTRPFPTFRTLTCTLKAVHSGVLNPTYYRDRAKGSLTLVFRDLNPAARTATIIGNSGGAPVEFRPSADQLQFIETTPMGSLTVTTVFAPPVVGELMPAVHSRHVGVTPANVSISQFAGDCASD